ncbi:hypothetical protein CC2G_008284 [Coprinopsis cinerea AmutBmut pab1-1]|nr:hypothetical protein CC2G_008284 [Coprinopsis cinerea AmutBmut pab1-1]
MATQSQVILNGPQLPTELLTLVFDYIARPWFDISLHEACRTPHDIHTCLAPLRLVCRRWNRIIVSFPWYWTTLEFGIAPTDFLDTCLQRSRRLDLTVIFHVPGRSQSACPLLDLACTNAPRIKRLDIRLLPFSDLAVLDTLLGAASSSLESLKLGLSDVEEDVEEDESHGHGEGHMHDIRFPSLMTRMFDATSFPKLREFCAVSLGCSMFQAELPAFSNHLTTVYLDMEPNPLTSATPSNVYSTLERISPWLTSLSLHNVVYMPEFADFLDQAASKKKLSLPHIQQFSLEGDLVSNALLLHWICDLPSQASVHLDLDVDLAPWSNRDRVEDWSVDILEEVAETVVSLIPVGYYYDHITLSADRYQISVDLSSLTEPKYDPNFTLEFTFRGATPPVRPSRRDYIIALVLQEVRRRQMPPSAPIRRRCLNLDISLPFNSNKALEQFGRILYDTPCVTDLVLFPRTLTDPGFSLLNSPESFVNLRRLRVCAGGPDLPDVRPNIWTRLGSFFATRQHHGLAHLSRIHFDIPSTSDRDDPGPLDHHVQEREDTVVDLFIHAKAEKQAQGRILLSREDGTTVRKICAKRFKDF